MKQFLLTILLCSVLLFAQSGFTAGKNGIHVPGARPLNSGELFVMGGFEMASSKEPASIEGYLTDENGVQKQLEKDSPSNSILGYIGYGIFDNLEVGLNLNFHYDGNAAKTKLKGLGFGDLGLVVKVAPPNQKILDKLNVSAALEIFIPSGTNEKGLRPRHLWYIHKDNTTHPYSAADFAMAGTLYLTLNINKYVFWNNYAGYLRTFENGENIFVWGSGLTLFAYQWVSLVLEASGETSIRSSGMMQGFLNDPLRFSPGVKIRLPKRTTLAINADLGMDLFRKRKLHRGHPITVKNKGHEYSYTVPGSPPIAASIKLSRTFDLSWIDTDGDGIEDRWDQCPQSNPAYKVNRRGCTVDSDGDGIADDIDQCPNTEAAVLVDRTGCPEDLDEDGIPNHLDKCPNTKPGDPTDEFGCIYDEDNDGVHDGKDKCPGTPANAEVNDDGCLLDNDGDGIPDIYDKCSGTPAGLKVDENGCFQDKDKDGVPDEWDQCPDSRESEIVNMYGCPIDSDEDGIPDFMDACENTPHGVVVDSVGCRVDQDKDGVFDDDDKCPETPEEAPVDSTGCPLDSDKDGVFDYIDNCPNTLARTEVDENGCPIREKQNLDKVARRILFHKGSEKPLNSSYTALSDIVSIMRHNKTIAIEIQCSVKSGESMDPQELSNTRATFIYDFLLNKGIKEERLKAAGYGLHFPPDTHGHTKLNPVGVRLLPYNMVIEEQGDKK
ncbi:MAG: thrombospondin type 3 repeat-containing protein [Fibrobacter sp.]|nr:thrombospondin type 3 repeat-containing protein [Fibrobacter sp.]